MNHQRILPAFFFFFFFQTTFLPAQNCTIPTCNEADCGVGFVSFAPSGSNVFCEGGSVILENTSDPGFDEFYIEWGDGIIDTVYDYNDIIHTYDFTGIDRCQEGPSINVEPCFHAFRSCANGISCNKSTGLLTVKIKPVARFTVDAQACVGTEICFNNNSCNEDSYLWDFGDGTTSTLENPCHIFNSTGFFQVTLVVENGCGTSDPETQTVEVIGYPEAIVDATLDPATGCLPLDVTFDNNSLNVDSFNIQDFQWSVSPNNGWYFNPDTIFSENSWNNFITFTDTGEYEVTLEVFNICGNEIWTQVITVYEAPTVNLQNLGSYCEEAVINFCDFAGFGGSISSYSWTVTDPLGGVITYNAACPTGTFTVPGSYTVDLAVGSISCGSVSTGNSFFIQSAGTPDFSAIPALICSSDDPFQLEAQPPGGVWSSNMPPGGLSAGGLLDPSVAVPGTPYSLAYDPPGDCTDNGSLTITVTGAAPVSVEDEVVLCTDNGIYQLQYSPAGGTWISPTGSVTPDGLFDPLVAGIGFDTLTYELVDAANCVITEQTIIEVEDLPVLDLPPAATFCETNDPIVLADQLAIAVDPAGGTFNWSGPGITNAATGAFNSAQAGLGTHLISATYQLKVCAVSDSLPVTVTAITQAGAGGDTTLCVNEGTYQLTGTPPGAGTWMEINGPGNGLSANTGELNLAAAGEGDHTYAYVLSAGTSCETQDQVTISIIDLSDDVQAGADFAVCADEPPLSLSGSPAAGTWSGPGITDPVAGVFDPSAPLIVPGTPVDLSYCIEAQNVECPACDLLTAVVHPLPVAAFSITGTTCIGEVLQIENNTTGAASFLWEFDNGVTATEAEPDHTYFAPGNYTITLTSTSAEGCTDSFTQNIFVTERPTPLFTTNVTEGCAELDVTFTNQSTGTNMSFLWDFGNGQTSDLENPGTITFAQGQTDTVYVVILAVTNECGTVFFEMPVTVFPQPIASFSPNVDDGCSPLPIQFANPSLGNPESFSWYIDGVLVSTDSLLEPQVFTTSDTSITIYEIMMIAENFCGIDTMVKEITVFPPNVEAFIFADTTRGCQPLTVNFGNFSTPGAQVSWDFGDGNGSFLPDPVHTFDSAGVFVVYQYATNCGTDTDSVVIEVLPAPDVSFTHDPYVCLGQPITFTDQSENTTGHAWDFGDGNTSPLTSPSHQYDSVGTFVVTLTGFSVLNNCPASVSSEVTVFGPPDIGFTPSATQGCAPFTIEFTNTSNGPTSYAWDFGDGETSNQVSPDHTFLEPDTYQVTLVGTDAFGCFADSTVLNIIVHEVPTAFFSTDQAAYCSTVETISVDNQSAGAIAFEWDFGGVFTSNLSAPGFLPVDTGSLVISLIAENQFLCRDTFQQTVVVLATPQAAIPTGDFSGCRPWSIAFANASQFADFFTWDFGDGNTSTDLEPIHTYLTAGNFSVQLIAEGLNGCPADTAVVPANIFPVPEAVFSISEELLCGLPASVEVTNLAVGAQDYDWQFGNGQSSSLFEPDIVYAAPGEFFITLVAANQYNCRDTFALPVSANWQPLSGIDPVSFIGCEPETILFEDASANATSWQWDFGDGTISTEQNPAHVYDSAGVYHVQLLTSYNGVCFDTLEQLGRVEIFPSPVADFSWMDLGDGVIRFTNLSVDAVRYEWDFGNGDFSTATSPTYEYNENGVWNVILTAFHANGCAAVREQIVIPEIFFGLYLPNAMSPESGIGDVKVFKPTGIGIKNYNVRIFSPWGQMVWFSDKLDGEQPGEVWDGQFEGEIVPQGSYVWKAEVEYLNKIREVKTGTVLVIR